MIQIYFDTPIKIEKALSISVLFPFKIQIIHSGATKDQEIERSINISITKTLWSIWDCDDIDAEKILFEFALDEIKSKTLQQLINENLELFLERNDELIDMPFDIKKIPNPNGYKLILDDEQLKTNRRIGFY
jgi:hypothetical protein